MIIIFTKPCKSVNVSSYGVSSYIDKDGKKIYKVYGIVSEAQKARVKEQGNYVNDIYFDANEVTIYRSESEEKAVRCKETIDYAITQGSKCFIVEGYKELENKLLKQPDSFEDIPKVEEAEVKQEVAANAD